MLLQQLQAAVSRAEQDLEQQEPDGIRQFEVYYIEYIYMHEVIFCLYNSFCSSSFRLSSRMFIGITCIHTTHTHRSWWVFSTVDGYYTDHRFDDTEYIIGIL